jgi:hypothetical protein
MKGVIPFRAYRMSCQPESLDILARYFLSSRVKAFVQEGFDTQSGHRARSPDVPQHNFQSPQGLSSQFLLMKLNSQCSIGFHFEHPVG